MQVTAAVIGAVVGILGIAGLPAPATAAITYPWCTTALGSGAESCGFASFEQCMAYVRGKNQTCRSNPQHVPPPVTERCRSGAQRQP